jgi:hypothetical protein
MIKGWESFAEGGFTRIRASLPGPSHLYITGASILAGIFRGFLLKLRTENVAHAYIRSVGRFLPERRLTNHDLEKMVDTTDEWISAARVFGNGVT